MLFQKIKCAFGLFFFFPLCYYFWTLSYLSTFAKGKENRAELWENKRHRDKEEVGEEEKRKLRRSRRTRLIEVEEGEEALFIERETERERERWS